MTDIPTGLVARPDALVASLREHGHESWARRMEQARNRIAAGDRVGIDRVLGAYGGMGSINDLNYDYRHPLMELVGEVYEPASAVRKNRERTGGCR